MSESYETYLDELQTLKRRRLASLTMPTTIAIHSEDIDVGISDELYEDFQQSMLLTNVEKYVFVAISSAEIFPEKFGEWFLYLSVVGFPQHPQATHVFELTQGITPFDQLSGSQVATLSGSVEPTEYEPQHWRGVFSPQYSRTVLFSQKLEIQTSKLPRYKPYISIDRRTLAREEDVE